MSWKLKFDAPKGQRIMKDCFIWVQVRSKSENQESMWNPRGKRFFDTDSNTRGMSKSSSMYGVNSVKAFKRFLRKHGENLRDYEVVLCSKDWVKGNDDNFLYDYTVTAEWVD